MYKYAQNISSVLGGGCVYVVQYSSLFQYLIYFSKGFLTASWTVALRLQDTHFYFFPKIYFKKLDAS